MVSAESDSSARVRATTSAHIGTSRQLGANFVVSIANVIKSFMHSVPSSINLVLLIMN